MGVIAKVPRPSGAWPGHQRQRLGHWALLAEVEKVNQDKHFMETLRKVTERDKEILDRLAG
jgi:hypothetical protein